ncbi:hypothetical protein ACWJOG_24485, partial [Escherichia coli]
PAVFFNGDRARFVTEVIKKKEEIEKKQFLEELETTSKNKDFETDDSVENLDLMIARLQKKKEELERKEKFGQWQDLEDAS